MGKRAKKIYHIVLIILSIVLIAAVVIALKNSSLTLLQLKDMNPLYLLALILLHSLGLIILGYTQYLPLKKINIQTSTKEWNALIIVSELFNLLLPANGGAGIRMMYLKDKKKLPIRQFLSMNFAVILTGFTMVGIVGTLYFQYVLVRNDSVFKMIESVFIALALCGILLLITSEIFGKLFKFKRKYSPKIYLFDTKLTAKLTFLWLIFFALYPLKIYLSFMTIGVHIGLQESLEIGLILMASTFFQVLPGNMGIKEIITAYVSTHYGINFETALLASLIDRAALMIYLVPVGMYFYWELFLDAVKPKMPAFLIRPSQSEQISP